MATSQMLISEMPLEDPLSHLPCSQILDYGRGDMIYNQGQPSTALYLVLDGRVKVCRSVNDGREVVINIYRADDFFGESAFLGLRRRGEQAIALEQVKLMTWTKTQIREFVETRPKLGVALIQSLALRELHFSYRIESFATDNIPRRLARSLIRLSERLGMQQADGFVSMGPFTQKLLAQYIGTTREVVSYLMNQFRRRGYVGYSRDNIILDREALLDWLRHERESTRASGARDEQEHARF